MAKIDEKCENCKYFEGNNYCCWCTFYDVFIEEDGCVCNEFKTK